MVSLGFAPVFIVFEPANFALSQRTELAAIKKLSHRCNRVGSGGYYLGRRWPK
jgi:hypothetical protein